jgi:hypothetical protein
VRSNTVRTSTRTFTADRMRPTIYTPESVTLWLKTIPVTIDDAVGPDIPESPKEPGRNADMLGGCVDVTAAPIAR